MKKIIVLFKTHLDLGFTDMAANVKENYIKNYLPNAMRVAKEMRGQKEGFIWTTGSWMIEQYLKDGEKPEELEDAIRHGEVRWHGLPFTTHTELMDKGLFRYGLGISKKLDERFQMNTIAAKMTDVPGHSIAMVPMLAEAGIRFLHLGVNPASTRPEVPHLFRWKAETGEEILVMYNDDYGELTEIGNSGTAVYFAHTGDNLGPQSAEQIQKIYEELHERYPDTELYAGTLEDVAEIALKEQDLPVVTDEIGDTWIHGAGTDPGKVSRYRALLRMKDALSKEEMEAVYQEILPVPEHTWGLDEKTWLGRTRELGRFVGEYCNFTKEEFEKARMEPKYRKMEESWREQRAYVDNGVKALKGAAAELAERVTAEYKRKPCTTEGYVEIQPDEVFQAGGYKIAVNGQGAVCLLEKDGRILADAEHLLGNFLYEVFSENEYKRFQEQYLVSYVDWALEDFGKIGMKAAIDCYRSYHPEVVKISCLDSRVVVEMKLPEESVEKFGGMKRLELAIDLKDDEVQFDFAWFGKQASRIAEASWLKFRPFGKITAVQKMEEWINPFEMASKGNRRLHAVSAGVQTENQILETLDAALVNIGEPGLLNFTNEIPSAEEGFAVNLHNNIWGTNFPMWYEEDARFRFVLRNI